ncbi:hypothetical protein [Frankia sp. Cas4]|nr:hypothetical protein [Frankia sp. Cas4]
MFVDVWSLVMMASRVQLALNVSDVDVDVDVDAGELLTVITPAP